MLIVPDTSVIIEGVLSTTVKGKHTIIIHEAVLAELESQANKRREIGYLGLEEIKKIQKKFKVLFEGNRPKEFEIKFAKSGEIDSLIRDLAEKRKAVLYTADIVQSLVAEAKGIKVKLFRKGMKNLSTGLEKYFKQGVMSVHLKEGEPVIVKKGKPGNWKIVRGKTKLKGIYEVAKSLISVAKQRQDAYIDSDNKGSTILQIGNQRIVITRPPFSDTYEITAVKPIKKLMLKDYKLSKELMNRINRSAEGILIVGSPGSGKSTFAQALAINYAKQNLIVKTVESPRDLDIGFGVTQYALNHAARKEVRDIFLLSRPDISLFDEVRNDDDFDLFSDLRLSGIGMIGILHATKPIDALQRFIQRIDLGVVPNIVDTLLFVEKGKIAEVYNIVLEVKVPYGMTEADLARPVVGIHDFSTGLLKYEVYTYGDQKVVMPVGEEYSGSVLNLARKQVEKELQEMFSDVKAFVMQNKILIHAADVRKFFSENNRVLCSLEKKFGMKVEVKQVKFKPEKKYDDSIKFSYRVEGNNMYILVKPELTGKNFDVYVDDDFVLTAKAGKNGKIKLSRDSAHAKLIEKGLKNKEKVNLKY